MPFIRPTLQTIIDRVEADIVSRLVGQVALLRNALLTILARVFAGAIHTCYGFLDYISINMLPDLADASWLERHGVQWSIPRIKATFATGTVIFTGTPATAIPAGTKVVRDDGIEYATLFAVQISGLGDVTVDVECLTAGSIGNTASGINLTVSSPISQVDDVVEVVDIGAGVDDEPDDKYRARIIFRIQNTPAGGAEHDYINLGKTVEGVDEIFVFGNYNGLIPELGYVTCVVLGVDPKTPGSTLLQDVEDTLLTITPVTAKLVVDPITEVEIDFFIDVPVGTSDEIKDIINANLVELFDVDGAPGGTILLSRINNAISLSGVLDFVITQIVIDSVPFGVANIELTDHNYPIFGSTTFGDLYY